MNSVFVYWDNSNIFIEARRHAEEREAGPDARYRVRVHFENLLRLAHADRDVARSPLARSHPKCSTLRMEGLGVEVALFDRGDPTRGEQEVDRSFN